MEGVHGRDMQVSLPCTAAASVELILSLPDTQQPIAAVVQHTAWQASLPRQLAARTWEELQLALPCIQGLCRCTPQQRVSSWSPLAGRPTHGGGGSTAAVADSAGVCALWG